jgi:SRSO17 transposase
MLYSSTILKYPVLTLLSIGKRSFENMGLLIGRKGDAVKRLLHPAGYSFDVSRNISQSMFSKNETVCVGIDDTLIKKIYSRFMQGAGMFFDTKIGRCIMAYRLVIGIITDGKFAIPIDCAYLFTKEILDSIKEKFPSKDDIAKSIVKTAIKLFSKEKIVVVVDGLYASVEFIRWCKAENIKLEARMHSNRVVIYNGERIKVKDLLCKKGLQPKGRQMARTISVIWHEIDLELTIVRRFDKSEKESIVFQIATYKALPRVHVANYKKRWKIEMLNRTTKQEIGLQECFSRSLETQHNHTAAVLLAYSFAQLERKLSRLDNVEQALKRFKTKSVKYLIDRFNRFIKDIQHVDA